MIHDAGGVHVGGSYGTVGVGVFVAGNLQGLQGERLRVAGLVEDGFPHQHRGVVAVAADDVARVLVYLLVPAFFLVPVLPAGGGYNDKQPQLVAGIHERRVLRIVGGADDGEADVAQPFGVAPLLRVGQRVAYVGEVLMAVSTDQLVVALAVQVEAGLASLSIVGTHKLEGADADAGDAAVKRPLALHDAGGYMI